MLNFAKKIYKRVNEYCEAPFIHGAKKGPDGSWSMDVKGELYRFISSAEPPILPYCAYTNIDRPFHSLTTFKAADGNWYFKKDHKEGEQFYRILYPARVILEIDAAIEEFKERENEREARRSKHEARLLREKERKAHRLLMLAPSSERAPMAVMSLQDLQNLSPQRFEDKIAELFHRLGYEVAQTPYTNDHGRDAIMHRNGKKSLLECKRYAIGQNSGRPDLQKFHSAIMTDNAASGFFVTTGGFTAAARRFAKDTLSIELIDGQELLLLLATASQA